MQLIPFWKKVAVSLFDKNIYFFFLPAVCVVKLSIKLLVGGSLLVSWKSDLETQVPFLMDGLR